MLPVSGKSLVILYYHSVFANKRGRFARQLDSLRQVRVVPANWSGVAEDRRPLLAITFDDAFQSVIDNALPELAARGMACTIFAPSTALGGRPQWEMESDGDRTETVIDAETLRGLPGALVAIGSHSASHPHLSRIPIEAARAEIAESKIALEALTGQLVDQFAFPYGDYDDAVVEACRSAGYEFVYSISPAPVDPGGNAFVRGRVSVDPGDGPLEFYLKSRGAFAWMPMASALKRRFAGLRP
jgi:peptidoglycan/xylan/chitin deacetylase (PgdA/CDA1 family)